jgi:hypothetical protein
LLLSKLASRRKVIVKEVTVRPEERSRSVLAGLALLKIAMFFAKPAAAAWAKTRLQQGWHGDGQNQEPRARERRPGRRMAAR